MNKRIWLTLLITTLLLLPMLFSGCATTGQSGQQGGETIKLGVIQATTTDAALLGVDIKNAVYQAVDVFNAAGGVNGKKIEIVFADAAQSDSVAVNAFNKVMDSKPVALVSTAYSTQAFAIAPLIEKAKMPSLTGGTNPKLTREASKYFIRVRPDDTVSASAATKYAVEGLKAKKVAVIYMDDQFGVGGSDIVKSTLKEMGLEAASVQAHGTNDKDVSAQLLAIKNSGADALITWEGPPQQGIVVKQFRQLGLTMPFIGSPSIGLPSTHGLLTDDEVNGVYGVVEANPGQSTDAAAQEYVKQFKAKYNAEPGAYGAEFYDGTMILLNAIKKVGTDPDAIMAEVKATKDYKGIANTYTSDKYANLVHETAVVKFDKKTPSLIQKIVVPIAQ